MMSSRAYNNPRPAPHLLHPVRTEYPIVTMSRAPPNTPVYVGTSSCQQCSSLRNRIVLKWRKVVAKVIAGIKAGRKAERFTRSSSTEWAVSNRELDR
jgi:hypothetical protein